MLRARRAARSAPAPLPVVAPGVLGDVPLGTVDGMSASHLPVVLLHGARTSRTMWRPQLEALEQVGRTAVAVDLPGHGRRTGETFTVEGSLATIDEAVAGIAPGPRWRVVVVGSSLGAYLGTAWAAQHPDRVGGLVVSGACTEPDRWMTTAWLQAARLIARLPDRGEWLNRTVVEASLPEEGVADVGEGGFALDVMVDLLGAMRAVRPLEDLPRIPCPVWFLNGQWDHFRLQERSFVEAAPRGRRVVVRGANHLANLSRPVAFTRGLLAALEEMDDWAREADARRRPVGSLTRVA